MGEIRLDDLSSAQTRNLLTLHFTGMRANSPPGACFVLDLSGLQQPDITLWSLWDGDAILGIGALKALPDGTGELKSMRTHPDHLRKGVAKLLLDHIIGEARTRSMTRLSLETGSGATFEPALALYRARGFVEGAPFGDYAGITGNGFSRYFHLDLRGG